MISLTKFEHNVTLAYVQGVQIDFFFNVKTFWQPNTSNISTYFVSKGIRSKV